MPGSFVGELLCGSWGDDATGAVWHLVRDRWPMLLAALVALITIRVLWTVWRRRVWQRHAAGARWLQITPPATATSAATIGLWRLLATVLPAPRRWALRPARLVWEVVADPDGMRCGLWLPPGVNPTAVVRLLQRGWPGVRAEQTSPPAVPTTGAVAVLAVWPTQPEWLPLVEDAAPVPRRGVDAGAPEEDRLRAVYGGLASAGRTGGALLQVHLGRAPAHRLRLLRRAMTNPQRARRARGTARAAGLLADGLRALILGVLDIFTPGGSPSTRRRTGATDPYTAELARQARAKYADAPHLLVAVHAVAAGPAKAAAVAAAADVSSGFGLLSAHFTRRRLRSGAGAAADRWVPEARMSLVSVAEAAAFAGLPAEPAAYGLPGAASRRRAATREVFRATPAPRRRPLADPPAESEQRDDPPTVWSTP
ncbi:MULTISPECIES: hypothetical protein [unclassified Micromonospora]|uniref:hypothetical protein n=1 Tax=unclassified Micromonospora TaxID=2617518 RepID=UPI00098D060C|nr:MULTISPECIES: hypothetical protein [unclassified Micromonospora]MDI5939183.1 hypothetical protein [Micromonospora sp. DH15]OON32063.1 hypothetical protein BSA16_07725 [Micromonospora sp. Rc5]